MGYLRLTWAPPACRLASFYGPLPTSSSVHAFLLPVSPLHWVLDQEPTPSDLSAPCLIFHDAMRTPCQGWWGEQVLWGLQDAGRHAKVRQPQAFCEAAAFLL